MKSPDEISVEAKKSKRKELFELKLIETLEKKYHEWQQKAREKYLSGYYPGHNRMPNFIVRGLYWIGYFIGDFIPLILNLINGIYWTIKQLVAFVVELLIEASISIVLLGSIVFSISHSIERLRQAGATGGLEYVGVVMFEVIFIGSAATLTGSFMKKKKPNGFREKIGFGLSVAGFAVGLVFVWWSNFKGMAPTLEGHIIGSIVPLLVLIGEGILAYRYLSESEKDDQIQLSEIIQRNGLTVRDVSKAIEMYMANRKSEHEHLNKEHPEQIENERVQSKQLDVEQTNIEHEQVEHKQTEHKQGEHEQIEREQVEHEHLNKEQPEQPEHVQHEQIERVQSEQTEQGEQLENKRIEQVEQTKQHKQNEQVEHEREQDEQTVYEQDEHKHEQSNNEHLEQNERINREQSEQGDVEQTNEHEQKRKRIERVQRKTKLYLVKGHGRSKVDIAVQCALKLMEQKKEFTVRELADMAGCSLGTAQNALNKLKEQKLAQ